MEFDYNDDELLLFDQIITRVETVLTNHFEEEVKEIEVVTRFRKFNFSVKVIFTNGTEQLLHIKSFYYAVEDGEPKTMSWDNVVLLRTRAIYKLIKKNNIDLKVPELVDIDEEMGLIITKMFTGTGLHTIVIGDDQHQAREGFKMMATSLADLHGMTYQLQEEFLSIRKDQGEKDVQTISWVRWSDKRLETLVKQMKQIDAVSFKEEDYKDIVDSFLLIKQKLEDSKFISLINSDPCPDNLLIENDRLTFIDLDTFSFYNFFIDVYYLWTRISCWCVGALPIEFVEELEQIYLTQLRSYLNITDEEFVTNLFLAGLLWGQNDLLMSTRKDNDTLGVVSDRLWGRTNLRSRIFSRINQMEEMYDRKSDLIADEEKTLILKHLQYLIRFRDDMKNLVNPDFITTYPAFE